MGFAGKFWRVLVGIKDALVLIFMLLFFLALFAILSASPSPAQVREGALHINLSGFVVEERASIDPLAAVLSRGQSPTQHEARDIVRALDAAIGDERIKAVVMDLSTFAGGGQVHMQDIGAAMDRVRTSGKPVLTYSLGYADDHMMLAAHASEVWLDPMGGALIAGPGGTFLFYAELLERLNVNARVYRVGEFKSAVEPYLLNAMSPEARGNLEGLYGSLWEEWQADVRKARPAADLDRVTKDPVAWVEASAGDLAKASLAAGLVDTLGTRAEFGAHVAELVGADPWDDSPGAYARTELAPFLADHPEPTAGKAIAVVTIAGDLVDTDEGPGTASAPRLTRILDKALSDDLAGLVVRVDSPGGSVLASESVRVAIERYRAKGLPVAVSFANVAASGGYWVATAGDRIFAEPGTITGSIGVFAVLPTFEDTARRFGVNADAVRTTPLSGQPDLIGGFTPEVNAILQASITNTYSEFIERVSKARKMSAGQVDAVGQGRVWDGGTARQKKLVDQFGGLPDALAWVAGKAGIEDGGWHARHLAEPVDGTAALVQQLLGGAASPLAPQQGGDLFALAAQSRERTMARLMADTDRLVGRAGVQAYCLECPAESVTPAMGNARSGEPGAWVVLRGLLGL